MFFLIYIKTLAIRTYFSCVKQCLDKLKYLAIFSIFMICFQNIDYLS